MRDFLNTFRQNTTGATAIEYAIIASLLSVVIITGVIIAGNELNETFSKVGSEVKEASK